MAVILACELFEDAKKIFFAHKGSTFGGITISKKIYSASAMEVLMSALDDYFRKEEFETVFIKMVSDIYQKQSTELLDYYLYKYGYTCYCELNYYMHLNRYSEDVISQFSSSKRRDYRYSLKNELHFKTLDTREEIALYYNVLIMNLAKLNLPVVHSLEDLYDLKFNRFSEDIKFCPKCGESLKDDVSSSFTSASSLNIGEKQYVINVKELKLPPKAIFNEIYFGSIIKYEVNNNKLIATLHPLVSPGVFVGSIIITYEYLDKMYRAKSIEFQH